MVETVRLIHPDELNQLLNLYEQLHPDERGIEQLPALKPLWDEISRDPGTLYIVVDVDGELVASCNLIIIKNLTRYLRPYALIENVITHPDYRKRGYGTRVLHKAVEIAKEKNCYKVMLMTGRNDAATLRFYENAGFVSGIKTGFIISL